MPFLDSNCWYVISGESPSGTVARPALFLDRDGVIIREKHYLARSEDVEIVPGAAAKLRELREKSIPVIIVTNQSGIAKGLFDWRDFEKVQDRIIALCELEEPFAAIYANSYDSGDTAASWRKPNPGMIVHAAEKLNLDLGQSILVGDKLSDLEAGTRAGIGILIHVLSGHGKAQRAEVMRRFPQARLANALADIDFSDLYSERKSVK